MNRIGDWIQTYSGLAFWPLDPRPDEIRVEDIAHALAMQCRFTGHVRRFYSVAEHSVRVSAVCEPADALWGLLHDASEAYLIDVARPVKRLPAMAEYKAAEKQLQSAIVEKFGLSTNEPDSVQFADKVLLGIEARDLLGPLQPGWEKWLALIGECDITLTRPWSPEEAEERFLARFHDLTTLKPATVPLVTVKEAAGILGRHAAERRRSKHAQPVITDEPKPEKPATTLFEEAA